MHDPTDSTPIEPGNALTTQGASVPVDSLGSAPVEQFRDWLQAIPRSVKPPEGFFASHAHAYHRVDLDIEN